MKIKTIILSTLFLFSIHCICANQIPKVAVIGGGGAGLTTAWLLEQDYDVTLFKKEGRLGGHANTIEIEVNGRKHAIDAGFEFFSDKMYPCFNRLLSILKVPVRQFPLIYTFYKTDGGDTVVLPPIHNGQIYWESLKPSNLFDLL